MTDYKVVAIYKQFSPLPDQNWGIFKTLWNEHEWVRAFFCKDVDDKKFLYYPDIADNTLHTCNDLLETPSGWWVGLAEIKKAIEEQRLVFSNHLNQPKVITKKPIKYSKYPKSVPVSLSESWRAYTPSNWSCSIDDLFVDPDYDIQL